jgi:DNA-binding NarL/FixJ family response regulator
LARTRQTRPLTSKLESVVRVAHFRVGVEDFVVVSIPSPTASAFRGLTEAERDVVTRLLQGCSNAEIARRRKNSHRTVANHIASIFRKLGVTSRAELAALLGAPSSMASPLD